MFATVDRFSEFADLSTDIPVPRSEAQRAASRRNGAVSNGPISPEGKSRSRLNALKHGLLANVISPPADPRGDDQQFRKIRRKLVEEFKPAAFTESLAISGLARDYVQLGRATRMIETLQRPPAITQEDSKKWLQVKEAQKDLRLIELVLTHDGNDLPIVTAPQAKMLAGRVAGVIEGFRADVAQAVEEGEVEEPEKYPEEVEQLRHSREMMALIGKAEKRLADQEHMTAVFCGRGKPARGDWRLVLKLLEESKGYLKFYLVGQEIFVEHMERVRHDPIEKFSRDPERLILLTRYLTKIERGIERKIRQLRQH